MLTSYALDEYIAFWKQPYDQADIRLALTLIAVLGGLAPNELNPTTQLATMRGANLFALWRSGYMPTMLTLKYLFSMWQEKAHIAHDWSSATVSDLCAAVEHWSIIIGRDGAEWSAVPSERLLRIACPGPYSDLNEDADLYEHLPNKFGGIVIGRDLGISIFNHSSRIAALDSLVIAVREPIKDIISAEAETTIGCDRQIIEAVVQASAFYYTPPVPSGLLRLEDEFEDLDCMSDVLVDVEKAYLKGKYTMPRGAIGLKSDHSTNLLSNYPSLGYLVLLICDNAVLSNTGNCGQQNE